MKAAQIVVDKRIDEILRATLRCVDSQELIHLVHVAMRAGIPESQPGGEICPHPSTSEIFRQLLGRGTLPIAGEGHLAPPA